MIVVIDSSVWISAIEFGGTPGIALESALQRHTLATCADIDHEVVRILSRRFGRDADLIRIRYQFRLDEAIRVEVTGEISGICRDPNDDCILECALKAGAQLIITGDKDLLTLAEFRGIRIVTARQYLDLPDAR